jgi:RNA polymerase sigma-70 factor (ECF subfamily)
MLPFRRIPVVANDPTDSVLAELAEVIAAQHRAAAAAWPTFSLPLERYRVHLAQRVADRAGEAAEQVVRMMPAADLYLAAACSDGDAAALAAFSDAYVPALRQALGKLGLSEATIDEAVQRVLVMIFVGEGGAPQIRG